MSADYLSQLLALQPPGAALPREPESVWVRLLAALADGFERVDARSNDLVRESDPRSCIELITDWERVCGLPGACLADDCVVTGQTGRRRQRAYPRRRPDPGVFQTPCRDRGR